MNKYAEAAEETEARAEYCRTCFGKSDRVTKAMEQAAAILTDLDSGKTVLCDASPAGYRYRFHDRGEWHLANTLFGDYIRRGHGFEEQTLHARSET